MEALSIDIKAGDRGTVDTDLDVRIDGELPPRLAVGGGSVLFVSGSCFHRRREVRSMTILAGGVEVKPLAQGMPRRDVHEVLHAGSDPSGAGTDADSEYDPFLYSYRSGFWALVPFAPVPRPEVVGVRIRAELEGGEIATTDAGRITLEPAPARAATRPTNGAEPQQPLVAICMATYNPPAELFERQVESIRAQTHRNWVCLVSDDHSIPARFTEIERVIGDDPRFVLSRSSGRLGYYNNFERALAMVPDDAPFVALADQDDRWFPDKLETLITGLGQAMLVYSDARLVDERGTLLADTFWVERRNNWTNLTSLLIANTVTGAAALFRRELIDLALPFPPRFGAPYHDNWLALVALATGSINYLDRPLYDYVQHRAATLGHEGSNVPDPRGRWRFSNLRAVLDDPRSAFAGARTMYFSGYCRLLQTAAVLRLRFGDRMPRRKRRAIDRFLAGGRSSRGLFALAWRHLRNITLGRDETLGAEAALVRAILWRYLVALLAHGRNRPRRGLPNDAAPPEHSETGGGLDPVAYAGAKMLRERLEPLSLEIRPEAPERVNLLIPLVDLRHFFGGYIAKMNIARRLAERELRVRLVTVDPMPPMPRDWRHQVEAYSGLEGLFDHVEVAFGREAGPLEVNPNDRFIATTWWTAHNARAALSELEAERFVYLIQEYEPFTFPMGGTAAIANQTYSFPHFALFSSELLREFFRRRALGVYVAGARAGDEASISFQNAITPVDPPEEEVLAARSTRRLLFYARPEVHAIRNMFEVGLLALREAVLNGTLGSEWELNGIGTVAAGEPIPLERGAALRMVPRRKQDAYAEILEAHDVGLALMYTPHPSLVPIEMASAGMLTVTNSFENKTPEALAAISSNLIVAEPSVDGVAAAIAEAVAGIGDARRRISGANVEWSRDWDSSFDDRVVDRVAEFIRDC